VYDDGRYQEFWMTVKAENDGAPLRVRSVRNCTPGVIEFFQPEPPAFLRHHGGIWRFRPLDDDATEVQITHVWNLDPETAAQIFPADEEGSTEEKVTRTLAGHSLGVDVTYFDGYNQEFSMTVERPGGEETVRGFRFCRAPYELELVQTTPPPMMAHMTGMWRFAETVDGGTEVTATRRFALKPPEAGGPGATDEEFAVKLGAILRTNLSLFKEAVEDA
jgi:hypothetical protein